MAILPQLGNLQVTGRAIHLIERTAEAAISTVRDTESRASHQSIYYLAFGLRLRPLKEFVLDRFKSMAFCFKLIRMTAAGRLVKISVSYSIQNRLRDSTI